MVGVKKGILRFLFVGFSGKNIILLETLQENRKEALERGK